jgi:DNA topoisomerase VI subunit B
MEFCTVKELVAQTGHEAHKWVSVIIKELVDNAIDACEEAEVAPVIKVTITTGKRGKPTRIVVADNGPGIRARPSRAFSTTTSESPHARHTSVRREDGRAMP